MLYIAVFIFGTLIGSFSNVCIYRLPIEKSVISGRSFCTKCKKPIRWFDNIPLISYLILTAKCRDCGHLINFQYFLVEFLVGVSFLSIFYIFGFTTTTILFFLLSACFIIIFFVDLKHYIIPNELSYFLMALGFLKSFDPYINNNIFPNYLNSLIGGLLGYFLIWLIIFFYKKIRNREGMGLGDAKLLCAIGFWFGWVSIPFVIFLSSFVALVFVIPGLISKTRNMKSQIPFGPYIIVGCLIYIIFMNDIKNFLLYG